MVKACRSIAIDESKRTPMVCTARCRWQGRREFSLLGFV